MVEQEMGGDYCIKCEVDFYQLIDYLIKDIQRLESEVVRLRFSLSWSLPKHYGEMLRYEVLSDLSSSYYDYPAYQQYISAYYDGHDPMESEGYTKHMIKLSRGELSFDF